MMQIVIDIPDKTYEKIMSNEYDYGDMNVIIQNGTPLPKGHGRLIDADVVDDNIYALTQSLDLNYNQISKALDDDIPTIIESDKRS